ncbi:MAG TPA: hypothetical protein VLC07_03505, partial [Solirubrobacterales bacterium]|nr:hypothetical protein [Solirubrobacterales bacterium]
MSRFFSRRAGFLALAAIACGCLAGATSANAAVPPRVVKPPKVSLSVPSQVDAGAPTVARGRATPLPRAARILLQLNRDRRWKVVAGRALKHRAFSLRFRVPADQEAVRVRAVLIKGGATLARSPARMIRVRAQAASAPPSLPVDSNPPPIAQSPAPVAEDPLSATSLMATVAQYARFPNHLSDTPTSAAALDEFRAALGGAGLQLGQQAFTYPGFSVSAVGLSADGNSVPATAIAPYLYSGTTGPGGVTATLFDGGNGTFDASKVAGKIVVASLT